MSKKFQPKIIEKFENNNIRFNTLNVKPTGQNYKPRDKLSKKMMSYDALIVLHMPNN